MSDPLFSLSGKVALVTRGTSGIGHIIATGLCERGVRTYVTGRELASAESVAAGIVAETGGGCFGLAADLSDPASPEALGAALGQREGVLHLLGNNAGANAPGSLADCTPAAWDMIMEVNVRGAFFLASSSCRCSRRGRVAAIRRGSSTWA